MLVLATSNDTVQDTKCVAALSSMVDLASVYPTVAWKFAAWADVFIQPCRRHWDLNSTIHPGHLRIECAAMSGRVWVRACCGLFSWLGLWCGEILCCGVAFGLTTTVRDCARQWLDKRMWGRVWCHDACAVFGALCSGGVLCAGVRLSQTFARVDFPRNEIFDFLQDLFSVESLAQRRNSRVALGCDTLPFATLRLSCVTCVTHLVAIFP